MTPDKLFGYWVLLFGSFIWIVDMIYSAKRGDSTMKSALICSGVVAFTALCCAVIVGIIQ